MLKIGTLYAQLTAQAAGFSKAMAGGTKDLERFAREAKRVSAEVAQASAIVAGLGAAAVRLASSVDGPTKKAMDGLHKSTQVLAVQVADMLLPAVRELTNMIKTAASAVAGLDPEVKQQIASMAVLAVQVAVAAKAFSVFSGLAANVFGVLKAGFAMVAAIGVGPLLNIVAAVGIVIGAVLLLHRAWRKNWGGIQEATRSVLDWLRSSFSQLAGFFGKVWDFLLDGAHDFINGLLNVAEKVEEITGVKIGPDGVAGLREGVDGMFKDLKSGAFISEAFEFGKTVVQEIADGVKEEAGLIAKEVKGAFGKFTDIKMGAPIELGRGMADPDSLGHGGSAIARRAAAHAGAERDRSGSARAVSGLSRADMIAGAVGAADWGQAQQILKTGLDGAADFGTTLQVWGERMSGVFARAGQNIFGAVGQLVSSIAEGAKQGGVWGAFMAAIMEVVQSAESAMEFLGTALNFVKQLGAMIEPLVKPVFDVLTDVLGAVIKVLGPIFAALKPLFEIITNVIDYLFPILSAIGSLFEALGPILEVVFKLVGMILQILEPIFKLVGGVIKVVATVLLGMIIALNELAAALGDQKAKAEAKRLRKLVDDMWKEGADDRFRADSRAAGAALRNGEAQDKAADAANKVTEALTNVPEGFRIFRQRYLADMGITSRGAAAPAAPTFGGPSFAHDDDQTVSVGDSASSEPAPYDDPGEMAWYNAYSDAIEAGKSQAEAREAGDRARAAAKGGGGGSQKSTGPGFKAPSSISAPVAGGGGGPSIVIYGDINLTGTDATSLQTLSQALHREATRKTGQQSGNPTYLSKRRGGS